jgi:hypothetical protein
MMQRLKCQYIADLVEKYGANVVGDWSEPPVTFEEWCKKRSFKKHVG